MMVESPLDDFVLSDEFGPYDGYRPTDRNPLHGFPTLRRLAEQHGLSQDELAALLVEHELPPEVAEELLHLATVEYRSLSRHGQKAAFAGDVERVINGHATAPRRP